MRRSIDSPFIVDEAIVPEEFPDFPGVVWFKLDDKEFNFKVPDRFSFVDKCFLKKAAYTKIGVTDYANYLWVMLEENGTTLIMRDCDGCGESSTRGELDPTMYDYPAQLRINIAGSERDTF